MPVVDGGMPRTAGRHPGRGTEKRKDRTDCETLIRKRTRVRARVKMKMKVKMQAGRELGENAIRTSEF